MSGLNHGIKDHTINKLAREFKSGEANMNQEKFALFSEAFKTALVIAYNENSDYFILPRNESVETVIPRHAQRILDEMFRNPNGVMYTGPAFKIACKTLGIKHSRKAIYEFLEIDKL